MADIKKLGVTHTLSNCQLTRVDIDTEHYYFIHNDDFPEGQFCASVTSVIDKAGPVGYGLREFWKNNSKQESEELLQERGERGSKLHNGFEDLLKGIELNLDKDYASAYEKAALTCFVRTLRFLAPERFKSELVVASPALLLAGTLDFVGYVDSRRLMMLANPVKYLDLDETGNLVVKPKMAELLQGEPILVKIVIDWKTSNGIHYAHEKQIIAYRQMYNESYAQEQPVTHCAIWRVSTRHKCGFELKLVQGEFASFRNIYDTYLDMNGGVIPEPPRLTVWPKKLQLLEATA